MKGTREREFPGQVSNQPVQSMNRYVDTLNPAYFANTYAETFNL